MGLLENFYKNAVLKKEQKLKVICSKYGIKKEQQDDFIQEFTKELGSL